MKSFQEFITEGEHVKIHKQKINGGKVITIKKGASTTAVLHPEHQEAIKNLKHGESTSFKDEQGKNWDATRERHEVHLSDKGGNKMTIDHIDAY